MAQRWDAERSPHRVGYVTRFRVPRAFLRRYPLQRVGGRHRLEYWVPADELGMFNRQIVGPIEVIAEYRSQRPAA